MRINGELYGLKSRFHIQGRFVRDELVVFRLSVKLDERLRTDGCRLMLGDSESRVDVFPFDKIFNKD